MASLLPWLEIPLRSEPTQLHPRRVRFFVTRVRCHLSSPSDKKARVILQAIVVTLAGMHLDPTDIPLAS